MILTYALCGFANFSSIGIQLGGIGGIAPERRSDLARLGLRAMLGGTLAAFMTACIAGVLISDDDLKRDVAQDAKTETVVYSESDFDESDFAATDLASARPISPSESESTCWNISDGPRNSRSETSPSRLRSMRTNHRGPLRVAMAGTRPSVVPIRFC